MEVKDGERHIYANFESCATNLHSHSNSSQDHKTTACPKILINTQMKNRACLQKKQYSKKKENASRHRKSEDTPKAHGSHRQASTDMVDTDSTYGEPEIHSALHVATALAQARKMQPNVCQLLKDKLDSPNTSSRLKKQVCTYIRSHTNVTIFPFDLKRLLTECYERWSDGCYIAKEGKG